MTSLSSTRQQVSRRVGGLLVQPAFIASSSRGSPNVEPVNKLLRGDTDFSWSDQRQQTYKQLKTALTSAAVLIHFDPRLTAQVTTDAPAVAIGSVLLHTQPNGRERPVAYASRTLTTAEQTYTISEREALACIWALERWHWFLYNRRFTLRTDYSSLTTLYSGCTKGRVRCDFFARLTDSASTSSMWSTDLEQKTP